MLRAITFVLVALWAAHALAAPTPLQTLQKRHHFRIQVPPRLSRNTRSGTQELIRTYAKYGWQIIISDPSEALGSFFGGDSSSGGNALSSGGKDSGSSYSDPAASSSEAVTSVAPTQTADSNAIKTIIITKTAAATSAATSASGTATGVVGEATATPEENESEYLTPVSIGGQSLNLDFDTGSADLWVFSSSLPSSESSGHTTFDPSKSSTWSEYQGGSWEISYGDGSSASGTVGFDKVNIGGATVTKQAVELATAVSGSFVSDENNDGLVGLGFSNINTVQPQAQKTFFENIMDSLALPLFTADLEDNASGSYTFGEIDSSEYTGDIHYVDIDSSNGFWQFDSPSYSIGGQTSQNSNASPAIADTGTSLVLLDEEVVKAYYDQVSSAQYSSQQAGYIYDCNADLPSFGIAIGDWTATIQGADITFAPLGDGTCFGGIQGNQGQGLQILGDVLFKQFFAVFDGGNKRFGVANKP